MKMTPAATWRTEAPYSIDIRDYGAKCDWNGTTGTDDTAAIQAAFDAAAAATDGRVTVIIPGRCKITSALTFKCRPGIALEGLGTSAVALDDPISEIKQVTAGENGINIQSNIDPSLYCTSVFFSDFAVRGPGLDVSTGIGINTHDDRDHDDHYNGGGLNFQNVSIGDNSQGFNIGLLLKRWDRSEFRGCAFAYNYTNVHTEVFTLCNGFYNCANSQAESVLWSIGRAAKLLVENCDNGNAPQWFKLAEGASVSVRNCNFESLRFSPSYANKRYNFGANDYASFATISSYDVGTGAFTASSNHGFKPGCMVYLTYDVALPSNVSTLKHYEVAADGFNATTFKLLPYERVGTLTSGNPDINVTTTSDLAIGDQVEITNNLITKDFDTATTDNLFYIVSASGANIQVAATSGGPAITPTVSGTVRVRPISPLIPNGSGSDITGAACPAFAGGDQARLELQHIECNGGVSVTAPLASIEIGRVIPHGYVTTNGFTGSVGGALVSLSGNGYIDFGPRGVDVVLKHSKDELNVYSKAPSTIIAADNSGIPNSPEIRGQIYLKQPRDLLSPTTADEVLMGVKKKGSTYAGEPILNSSIRNTITTGALTYQLAVNTRVFASGASLQGFTLPPAAQIDDEIEIIVMGAGGVDLLQNAIQEVRQGGSVTTNGTGGKLTLAQGDVCHLKCYATSGAGYWMVIGGNFNATVT